MSDATDWAPNTPEFGEMLAEESGLLAMREDAARSVEVCGYAIVNRDGDEEPCDQPATGWRWYQGHDHEDALDVACVLHENEGGRRIHDAEASVSALMATVDELHASIIEMGEYGQQDRAEVERLRSDLGTLRHDLAYAERRAAGIEDRAEAAEAKVAQLREWQREVCDRYGYDSEEPGATEEVLTALPFWLGEEAARRDAMAHVKALCDAEDERVAEVNARFAAKGITDKTSRPLTITGILPSLEVRHALFGPDSIEPPCPKHPRQRAEDCIPCAVGA